MAAKKKVVGPSIVFHIKFEDDKELNQPSADKVSATTAAAFK